MTILEQIQPFIQAYILAVSAIMETEVTIVDASLIRIGGSGIYKNEIGREVSHGSFFQKILQTGKPGIIKNVHDECLCQRCPDRESCRELANLGYPIFFEGSTIGVIGVVAFDAHTRARLIRDYEKLREFAKYMGLLIENRIQALEYTNRLSIQLEASVAQNVSTNFLWESKQMHELITLANKVALSESTILITGESGTGKEEMAKYLHSRSNRKNKLMVTINCAAIPENLVESELFGYEGGSFTGAKKGGSIGKIELANGGTLFLDEVGELPLPIQTKLLRFIQERIIERVGGTKNIPVDVRIICATNQDLKQMVDEHRFRNDLYYRINVIPIEMPPLRERKQDIEVLAKFFLGNFNSKMRKNLSGFAPDAMKVLYDYPWPGNVRELRNIIEYLVNVVEGSYIGLDSLPTYLIERKEKIHSCATLKEMLQEYEKAVLVKYASSCGSLEKKQELAKQLGLSQATLYRKLTAHHLL